MTPSEPLFAWTDALAELAEFLASFFAAGAIGMRFVVLRPFTSLGASPEEHALARQIVGRVAVLGALGAWATFGFHLAELPGAAAERHVGMSAFLASMPGVQVQLICAALAAFGLAAAIRHSKPGWQMAALGVLVGPFSAGVTGKWLRLVNPVHMLAGGLWIGTLVCLTVLALPAVLRSGLSSERRGAACAALVRAFSPLALTVVPVLVAMGVVSAWRNLHGLRHLWSTPYGYALLVKLALVALVATLGAWNWRRHSPRLGSEGAARDLWRSARAEISIAGLVLIVTAILVSLPSPEAPGR